MILNTTFMVHPDIEDEVLQWIRESYIPCAAKCGASNDTMLARVLDANPDGAAYALHINFDSAAGAAKWNDGAGASIRALLAKKHGDRVLTFTSFLQPLQ